MTVKTKVKIDLSKINAKIQDVTTKLENKQLLESVARIAIDDIRGNAREGKPFVEGKESSFPSLETKTEKRRKRLATVNTTDRAYSPARSNLTFTGQLLNSLKFSISGLRIKIFPSGTRSPYNYIRGGQSKSVSNKIVAQGLAEKGFKFLGIGEPTERKIRSEIVRTLRRLLKS